MNDETGHLETMGVSRDIGERKLAEETLRASEQRFRLLHELLPVGYHSLDERGCLIDVNNAWLTMVGYTREEMIGRWLGDFLPVESAPLFRTQFAELKTSGQTQVEFEIMRKDGACRTVFVVVRVARDEQGNFRQAHCIATDITEKKWLDAKHRQAQKLEALGRLAAGVAHDFNNQLTVIQGYCDLLLDEHKAKSSLREALTQIRQASRRAQSTTGHLLSFSRQQILKPEPVDLRDLLREMQNPFSRILGEGIKVVLVANPDVPPVYVDRSGLQQAITNLVINSRDAMPNGGRIVLQTSLRSVDESEAPRYAQAKPGQYVLLEVIDTGCGMDRETLDRAYDPFFTTKGVGKGTGLGIPMVQGFINQSNGFMAIQSQLGTGTAVHLLLPPSGKTLTLAPVAREAAARPSGKRARILVVEDEPAVRSLIAKTLAAGHYDVLEASCPSEAIATVKNLREPIDLLLTDVVMPEMKGTELAKHLKAEFGVLRVLFITGYSDHAPRGRVIRKPFDAQELIDGVRISLDAHG